MPTLTTDGVAQAIVATLVAQGVVLDDEAVASTEIAGHLTDWLGGADAVPVDLSLKLNGAIGNINADQLQRIDWWTGPADGGPNNDGLYPMTNAAGVTALFPSLAKIFATVGTVDGDPAAVIAEVEGLVTEAETARAGSENAQVLTAGYLASQRPAFFGRKAAITDEYGLAIQTVDDQGFLTALKYLAKIGAFAKLADVKWLETAQGDTPLTLADSYGLALLSLSSEGLLKTLLADFGGLTAQQASISQLAVDDFSLDTLDVRVIVTAEGEYVLAVVDSYGLAGVKIGASGIEAATLILTEEVVAPSGQFQDLDVGSLGLSSLRTPDGAYTLGIVDEYGLATALFNADGVQAPNIDALEKAQRRGALAPATWDYERNLIFEDGQSLSTGYAANPAISTAQAYGSLMLSGGVRCALTDYSAQTLVPLVEATVTTQGETPLAGALDHINALILSENAIAWDEHSFELVGASTGIPGASITAVEEPSSGYNRKIGVINRVAALSLVDGKTFAVRAINWTGGETDADDGMAFETYITKLRGLRSALDADAKAITGQTVDVEMFTYQTSSHSNFGIASPTIALAQLEASVRDDHIHLVTPLYMMDHSDGVHLTAASSRWLGAYKGLAYKRVVIDGADWKPTAPKTKIIQGATCILVFDVQTTPLVFDTVQVVDPGNYGFDLVDSAGDSLTISSVSLAGPDRVKIVAAATIPAGAKVRYAWKPGPTVNSGRITGPRGCLRDSSGDLLPRFDPAGINKAMHLWSVFFEI